MKKHISPILFIAGILFFFTGCASMEDSTGKIDEAIENSTNYQCQSGKFATTIPVTENSITVIYGKKTYPMIRAISASGARYSNSIQEWWEKGDEATLQDAKTGDIIDTCTVIPQQ